MEAFKYFPVFGSDEKHENRFYLYILIQFEQRYIKATVRVLSHVLPGRNKTRDQRPIYSMIENKSENAYVLKFWMTILVLGWSRIDFFLRNRL